METMPSLRADIADTLDQLSCSWHLWRGAQTLRWIDARERALEETEIEDLTEQIDAMQIEHERERDEWAVEIGQLEQTIARLREDLAEALAD